MKEKYLNKLFILLLSVLIIITFIVGYQVGEMRSERQEIRDTVTIVEFDTITITKDTTITKFLPKIIEKLRVDTVKKDTVLITEQKTYIDTICQNQDSILLKTTISGINARIDSLQVSLKKQEIIKTNTITITKYIDKPKKLITIQPQAGFGYGLMNNNVDMYVGVGIGVNL